MKVTAEVIVEITDEAELERAVLADIDAAEFSVVGDDMTVEDVRAFEREAVKGDAVAAVERLADPGGLIDDGPGIEFVEGMHDVVEVDEHGFPLSVWPRFDELFPLCQCGRDSCETCGGYQMTPRTAAVLWTVGQLLGDRGYDDVIEHGDEPVGKDGRWSLFDGYPRITWRQNAVWRRQAARSFDDLTADLAAGNWPQPRCPAEEMALHLILRHVQAAVADGWAGVEDRFADLLEHEDDLDWDLLHDVLFQDLDILELFDVQLDGIEDPETEQNRQMGVGDYRPQAWFESFLNLEPRDGGRPFRR